MARAVLIVNATQIVVSESNPQGLFSVMSGYPKTFDSALNNGDTELTMKKAKSEYYDRLGKNYGDTNENRVMTTVTLEVADGEQMLKEVIGTLPDMSIVP